MQNNRKWWSNWLPHFEYWSFWTLYAPVLPYGLWLALKARSLTYYTAANPAIPLGGIMGESKIDILQRVLPQYLPQTLFFEQNTPLETILTRLEQLHFQYPLIIKPNIGERGNGVEKINDQTQLIDYLKVRSEDFLIQAFIDYPYELGVLYYRYPNGTKSGIVSVVRKEFLGVTGNGTASLETLMRQDRRSEQQIDRLGKKLGSKMQAIIPQGEFFLLEPIGNHCRGTKFLDGNYLINHQLVKVFDQITASIDGFYYGRFDLKVRDLESLYQGEGIKILEINGITSEPAHIYDPQNTLPHAYKAIIKCMTLIAQISHQNHQRGVPYARWSEVWAILRKFWAKNEA